MNNLNNLVKAAIFTSTSIALGYAFILIPNFEFISITVFLAGFTLGISWGALVGGTSIFIYSVFNPLGSGLIYFPLLIGQIVAMIGIGVLGGLNKKLIFHLSMKILVIFSGFLGFICSLWYNGIMTIVYPLSAGYSLEDMKAYFISGIIFTMFHTLSNTIIFLIVIPSYKIRIAR